MKHLLNKKNQIKQMKHLVNKLILIYFQYELEINSTMHQFKLMTSTSLKIKNNTLAEKNLLGGVYTHSSVTCRGQSDIMA